MKNSDELNMKIRKRLKECRLAKGMTQKEFSEASHYSVQQICYIENGKRQMSLEAAHIFSSVLEVRTKYLLCEDNIKTEDELTSVILDSKVLERILCDLLACSKTYVAPESFEFKNIVKTENDSPHSGQWMDVEVNNMVIYDGKDHKGYICLTEDWNNLEKDIFAYIDFRISRFLETCDKLPLDHPMAKKPERYYRLTRQLFGIDSKYLDPSSYGIYQEPINTSFNFANVLKLLQSPNILDILSEKHTIHSSEEEPSI